MTKEVCGPEWTICILNNYRTADPLNVAIAIENAIKYIKSTIEKPYDPTYDEDCILTDALKEC